MKLFGRALQHRLNFASRTLLDIYCHCRMCSTNRCQMGGLPVVTILSQATGLPAAFLRKERKPYGTMKSAEALAEKGVRLSALFTMKEIDDTA